MKYLFTLLLLHNFLLVFAQTDAVVLRTEQERFNAMTGRDTSALRELLSEDLIYIHSNTLTEDKKSHLAAIASGTLRYLSMDREKVQIRRYGKIAVTNGTIHVKGTLKDKSFDIRMIYTAIYKKRKKHWQLLNWQSTRIVE